MKYLAHIESNLKSEIISIYDVIKGLNGESPSDWEGRIYYSLWYTTPMKAVVRTTTKKPHFAFANGFGGNENSGGGESIEHQLSKKIILDLGSLNIKIGKIEDKLNFSEIIIEQPFENGRYSADLYCKISNKNNFGFPINSMIVIELHLTNKVKKSKEKFYRNNNLTAIEVNIYKEIKFEGDIEKLQRQLKGYFQKQRFAKRLHDPNWKKILLEREKQKEVEKQLKIQIKNNELNKLEAERKKVRLLENKQKEVLIQKQNASSYLRPEEEIPKPTKKSILQKIIDFIVH